MSQKGHKLVDTYAGKTQFSQDHITSQKSRHGKKTLSTDFVFREKEFGETLSAMKTSRRSQEFKQSDATCVAQRASPKVQPVDNSALSNCTDNRTNSYNKGRFNARYCTRKRNQRTQVRRKARTNVLQPIVDCGAYCSWVLVIFVPPPWRRF